MAVRRICVPLSDWYQQIIADAVAISGLSEHEVIRRAIELLGDALETGEPDIIGALAADDTTG